ncbi:hypothetical protein [Polyangium aurulentum]|uniref:hypothetical protein n=1 Tax=Polyangium aurulentum TaxID=2567896 RepID=UPI001F2ECD16|nr:hypothetical protein [Polyangium aurulentum]
MPLLHPAHVLSPGAVSVGAGLSGQPVLLALPHASETAEGKAEALLQERTVAPALAPWASARIGIAGSNEAGLSYSGRAVRLDGRHAFKLSKAISLSAGLGGELLLIGRPRAGEGSPSSVLGGGFDVPVLVGWTSTGGLYSAWIGPRAGLSWIGGEIPAVSEAEEGVDVGGQHLRVGLVAGLRAGFRHVHVALELGGDWHHVNGTLGGASVAFDQLSLTPAGAIVLTF